MTVRLVADIRNRLFCSVGTGRASECRVPLGGWSQASRDGQRCVGWAAPAGHAAGTAGASCSGACLDISRW